MHELQLAGTNRLKNVLSMDKNDNPIKITNVLKSDLLFLLSNYMEISPEDLDLVISVEPGGGYKLEVQAQVRRLKLLGSFNTDTF